MRTTIISCLLLSIFPFFLISCQKEDDSGTACPGSCTVLQGRLTTAGGNQPLAGVPLEVNWYSRGGILGNRIRTKARGTTDAQGNYSFRFLLKEEELTDGYLNIDYSVDPAKYVIAGSGPTIYPEFASRPQRDTTVTTDVIIPRKALLKYQVIGTLSPTDSFYSLFRYQIRPGQSGGYGVSYNWFDLPPSPTIAIAGDQPVFVTTTRIRNGVRTETQDTLHVAAGQTVPFTARF